MLEIKNLKAEINNEKIDILEWNEKTEAYIANSLKPAKIARVIITNEEEKQANPNTTCSWVMWAFTFLVLHDAATGHGTGSINHHSP